MWKRPPTPEARPSIVGDLPISEALAWSAPSEDGARGRGGVSKSSLGGRAACLVARAQSAAGPAIEHVALRWP